MSKIYCYCRISTKQQSIERQIRNAKKVYPDAIIIEEVFTGTKIEGREKWNKLFNQVKEEDIIVFDSVSRMSRNAEEGFELYKELLNRGVELEFLKEPHINTRTYKVALGNKIKETGNVIADKYIRTTNEVIELIAEQQIKIAFDQAEKEVSDLKQRTKEGIETARLHGKQIGGVTGRKLTTKKSIEAKEKIMRLSRDFNGGLADIDVINRIKISRNSYYKYKKELMIELEGNDYKR